MEHAFKHMHELTAVSQSLSRQRHCNVLLRVQNVSSIDRDIEFVCQISEKYDVTEQLHAGVSVLTFLQKLTAFNDEKRGAKSTWL